MAREEKVWEYAIEAGYAPLEDRCIIVKGAAGDLSEKIVRFFETWDVAVLQMCENEGISESARENLGICDRRRRIGASVKARREMSGKYGPMCEKNSSSSIRNVGIFRDGLSTTCST